ncbi:hypothetical protein RR48_05251 [Papilio machaon]|uniref:Uncharacterized protein n=1 Tax=Papilio machaon TaxID=76193 RepID=A0A0N1IPG9_PAPMA|nr:hypothetical protein RR48_05251 [Papilio machaon]
MEKLKFEFTVKPAEDEKSNIICVTSITTTDGHIFAIPLEHQPIQLHKQIMETSNYAKVKKSLTKRHQSRRIWITLTDKIAKIYLDEEQNLQFNDFYLEEILENTNDGRTLCSNSSDQTVHRLLENLFEEKQKTQESQNLVHLAKNFLIDKFTGRNSNACQWIQDFTKECHRFQIIQDKQKIEMLKNFLESASSKRSLFFNSSRMKIMP